MCVAFSLTKKKNLSLLKTNQKTTFNLLQLTFLPAVIEAGVPQLIRPYSWGCRARRKAGHLWSSSCYWLAVEKNAKFHQT